MIDNYSLEYKQIIDKLTDNFLRQTYSAYEHKLMASSVSLADYMMHVAGAYLSQCCIILKKTCVGSDGQPLSTLNVFDLFMAKMREVMVKNEERMRRDAH